MISSSLSSFSDEDSDASEDDAEYGPSIYVVNEQYIKPLTAEAGKMSWALMMNPEGLDCHVFVSHAWQEGIFEFLSKVLASWPSGARNAWCCMLANPQNLNIGSMLQSPRTSPFALALQAADHVLVVANRHQSVYCRLWCGYEAYIASEKAKIIKVATPPKMRRMMICLVWALVPMAAGFVLGTIAQSVHWEWDTRIGIILISLLVLTSAFTTQCFCLLPNYMGLVVSCCMLVCWAARPKRTLEILDFAPGPAYLFQAILWFCCIAYFLIAEIDRLRSGEMVKEGRQLRKHYEGSISMASCSQASDMQNIWAEIGGKVHEVDHAIDVLISAGLSSPSLRLAAKKGVSIAGAGHVELAIPVVFLGPEILVGVSQLVIMIMNGAQKNGRASVILELISVLARLVFALFLYQLPSDERCFMLKVLTKLVGIVFFPTLLGVAVLVGLRYEHAARAMGIASFMSLNVALILALVFACLGIRGTLCLPGGRCLLRIFLHRGRSAAPYAESDETEESSDTN